MRFFMDKNRGTRRVSGRGLYQTSFVTNVKRQVHEDELIELNHLNQLNLRLYIDLLILDKLDLFPVLLLTVH